MLVKVLCLVFLEIKVGNDRDIELGEFLEIEDVFLEEILVWEFLIIVLKGLLLDLI